MAGMKVERKAGWSVAMRVVELASLMALLMVGMMAAQMAALKAALKAE